MDQYQNGNFDSPAVTNLRSSRPDPERDFADALLAALAGMAARSHRRQADLFVAARRFGISAPPDRIRQTLHQLQADGCVERVVPLADGGVLLSITGYGLERLSQSSLRHLAEGL